MRRGRQAQALCLPTIAATILAPSQLVNLPPRKQMSRPQLLALGSGPPLRDATAVNLRSKREGSREVEIGRAQVRIACVLVAREPEDRVVVEPRVLERASHVADRFVEGAHHSLVRAPRRGSDVVGRVARVRIRRLVVGRHLLRAMDGLEREVSATRRCCQQPPVCAAWAAKDRVLLQCRKSGLFAWSRTCSPITRPASAAKR